MNYEYIFMTQINDAQIGLTLCHADRVNLPNFASTNRHCNMVTFPNENTHIFNWTHNFSSCQLFVCPRGRTIENPYREPWQGRCEKKKKGRKGGENIVHSAIMGPGLEPGICHVRGDSQHTQGHFSTSKPFIAYKQARIIG